METLQPQKTREKVAVENGKEEQPKLHASPPSAASSPSHEFSFTISLHTNSTSSLDKSKSPSSFAMDLSPADEIFFHGHLLPLQLLSHLPVSPRSSTNSLDSFTLPIRELVDKRSTRNEEDIRTYSSNPIIATKVEDEIKVRSKSKSKSFSIFGLNKRRKGCEVKESEEKEKNKRKRGFTVRHVLKRYMRLVRPLFLFKWRRESIKFQREPYSFSGNLSMRNKPDLRGKGGGYSAPASMRTSPTNSGLLLATTASLPCNNNDSTMEELQAAIQAAIAHCKSSIATEEKLKS